MPQFTATDIEKLIRKSDLDALVKMAEVSCCEECNEPIALKGYDCQECCDHEPDEDEGYHCLRCGMDCSEDVMAAAYDRAKNFRKYGHD